MNLDGATRMGSVGRVIPGMEIRVAPDGELLVRGPNVFKGYMGQPEATAETMDGDWLLTGDLGRVDEDGYVYITGRKKDLIITSGGKNISPGNIEASLMDTHMIEHAVVCGDGRNYLTALVTLDTAALAAFAKSEKISGGDKLLTHPRVLAQVQAEIDQVNAKLTRVYQVRKFTILPNTLTVEAGELTPTLKVKRKVVMERQRALIDAMYANGNH
jgi:long-chain acyl-CoA synthetase